MLNYVHDTFSCDVLIMRRLRSSQAPRVSRIEINSKRKSQFTFIYAWEKYLIELTEIMIKNERFRILIKFTRFLIKFTRFWLFQTEF